MEITQAVPREGTFMALPAGTVVDRYRIESLIAAGGFGITYRAIHESLGRIVAIKEHFPRQFAYREATTSAIKPTDPDTFTWALNRFFQEGQALAKCHHPNVVSVADVFRANETAYMVLGFEEGRSLRSWLEELRRPPTQDELDAILGPLLSALEYVHSQGILHRDIAPDNIMIRRDGTPCLIDFGAARQAVAERSQMMSAIIKSGYSPPEQYTRSGRSQGTWSDIYALGATLYRAVTGTTPQESTERQVDDDLRSVKELVVNTPARYRSGFLFGIDEALRLRYSERPQTIDAWRSVLLAKDVSASKEAEIPTAVQFSDEEPLKTGHVEPKAQTITFAQLPPATSTSGQRKSSSLSGLIIVGIIFVFIAFWWLVPVRQPSPDSGQSIKIEEPLKRAAEERKRVEAEKRAADERAKVEEQKLADEERAKAEAQKRAADEQARIEAQKRAEKERARIEAQRIAEEDRAKSEAQNRAAEERARIEAQKRSEEDRARNEAQKIAEEERAKAETQKRAAEARARIESQKRDDEGRAAKQRLEEQERLARERLEAQRKIQAEGAKKAPLEKRASDKPRGCNCSDVCDKPSFYAWINKQLCQQCKEKCN